MMLLPKRATRLDCFVLSLASLMVNHVTRSGADTTYVCYDCNYSAGTNYCTDLNFNGAGTPTKDNCACCTKVRTKLWDPGSDISTFEETVSRRCIDAQDVLVAYLCLPGTTQTCRGDLCNGASSLRQQQSRRLTKNSLVAVAVAVIAREFINRK